MKLRRQVLVEMRPSAAKRHLEICPGRSLDVVTLFTHNVLQSAIFSMHHRLLGIASRHIGDILHSVIDLSGNED